MNIISRKAWGARPAGRTVRVAAWRRKFFIVHYSGGPGDQSVRAIQDWCMDGRGFADIDYNFLVRGTTGEVYEGRGWDVVGAHTKGYNSIGLGVCVITDGPISQAAREAVAWLWAEGSRRAGGDLQIRGHRDLDATECPGDEIYSWLQHGIREPSPEEGDDVDAADVWTRRTIKATAATAARIGGEVEAGDLVTAATLLQNAVVDAEDARVAARVANERLAALQATTDDRLTRIEGLLRQLVGG